VEALRRHHVGLVDDVDLVAALGRTVGGPLPQLAGIVDATVRRCVDLDDVDGTGPTAGERHARVTGAARGVGRPLLTVQAAGEDAGTRRLAAPARTAEQIGVVDAPGPQRLLERPGHVLLADDV